MQNVNVGGVPEHFNLSWYLSLKNKEFKAKGINLRWHDYYGGTGAMCKALRSGDIDIAVVLTEGIVADIIAGNPSKIVQTFVKTPLVWGIHVAANSKFKSITEIKGKRAAISRYGSGSHLMAYINAEQQLWDLKTDLHFEVVKNLEGAIEALSKEKADYFLWEKFTTKPLVDNGIFRCIGECPSPWPCFVIAASNKFIEKNSQTLQSILTIINTTTVEFKSIPSINKTIANRYEQNLQDVNEWLSITEWSQDMISLDILENVQNQLFKLGIISKKIDHSALVLNTM